MNGVKKWKFDQRILVASIEQVKIGSKNENVTLDVIREFEFVRLSWRHKENARWFYFILIRINHMETRTFQQIQHFKEIMPVWIFHAKMPVGIKHFHLKLLTFSFGRTEIVQAINR